MLIAGQNNATIKEPALQILACEFGSLSTSRLNTAEQDILNAQYQAKDAGD